MAQDDIDVVNKKMLHMLCDKSYDGIDINWGSPVIENIISNIEAETLEKIYTAYKILLSIKCFSELPFGGDHV